MSHQVQVIWILCLSAPHHTDTANENITFDIIDNSSQSVAVMDNDTLAHPSDVLDVVTSCQPSAPFLVTEPPSSIMGHEGSLVTITIVFCDIICNVDNGNVSTSDLGYEDLNMTCSRQEDEVFEDTSCEEDIIFDGISENVTDTSNTTVKWSLSGVTLLPGTW